MSKPPSESISNTDPATVASFGAEWSRYDQLSLDPAEMTKIFDRYFHIFPWEAISKSSIGFDMGCGSGRWALKVAPRVGKLFCVDPSEGALNVARQAMAGLTNVEFVAASANNAPFCLETFDFGYSLGVLHHVPDTSQALAACVSLLKPGAPFLIYLYYRFDNRPIWFYFVWRVSELIRSSVSKLPNSVKFVVTDFLAILLYWPLARLSKILNRLRFDPSWLPLSFYRDSSLYTMRTDCRDRFGTPLERRFTRLEIEKMMTAAGLANIVFSEKEPYWVALGTKI